VPKLKTHGKVREGTGSVAKVTTELKYLISSTWDWQVRKLTNGKYEFVVPSKADLALLTKFQEFQCKSSDLKVIVEKASLAAGCVEELKSTWVRILGVPHWVPERRKQLRRLPSSLVIQNWWINRVC